MSWASCVATACCAALRNPTLPGAQNQNREHHPFTLSPPFFLVSHGNRRRTRHPQTRACVSSMCCYLHITHHISHITHHTSHPQEEDASEQERAKPHLPTAAGTAVADVSEAEPQCPAPDDLLVLVQVGSGICGPSCRC